MAKKSLRRVVHHEGSQSGCMSGLIGIFDFRQARSTRKPIRLHVHEGSQSGCMSGLIGIFDFRQARSTRKLLSDKRHVSWHVAERSNLTSSCRSWCDKRHVSWQVAGSSRDGRTSKHKKSQQ